MFMLMSSLEYIAMITLMFSVFRFNFRGFIPHTIFICILQSYISYTIRDAGFPQFAPTVQMIVFIVCIVLLYRVHWYYSFIMGVVGYQGYLTVQAFLLFLAISFGMIGPDEAQYDNLRGILIVLLSAAIPIALAIFMRYRGWGYTFVPTSEHIRIELKGVNLMILCLLIVGVVVSGVSVVYFSEVVVYYGLSFLQLLVLLFLLRYAQKKEMQDV